MSLLPFIRQFFGVPDFFKESVKHFCRNVQVCFNGFLGYSIKSRSLAYYRMFYYRLAGLLVSTSSGLSAGSISAGWWWLIEQLSKKSMLDGPSLQLVAVVCKHCPIGFHWLSSTFKFGFPCQLSGDVHFFHISFSSCFLCLLCKVINVSSYFVGCPFSPLYEFP